MEDSTVMTIEFLRARLLAERSVSKTTRLRVDELAKRVMELEEEVKIVSLQKEKAEKASADVLAILESHGVSDVSETLDSSSDQKKVPCEAKVSNSSKKEGPVRTKVGDNGAEESSGSEVESSPVNGARLCWEISKASTRFQGKKQMNSSVKRQAGFTSPSNSSPKPHIGRSCRQIRRREPRSAVEEPTVESVCPDAQETRAAKHSEDFLNNKNRTTGEDSQNQREKVLLDSRASNFDGREGENDMERALEHQAQLIGLHEAEEKAQREWEDKFRENNNSSTPDSCEPGNHSDITEERDEGMAQAPYVGEKIGPLDQSSKSEDRGFQNQKGNRTHVFDTPASEFEFPVANEDSQTEECFKNDSSYHPSSSPPHCFCQPGCLKNQSETTSLSYSDGCIHYSEEASGSHKEMVVPMSKQEQSLVVAGGVLEALQQARLLLKQNLNRLPLLNGKSSFPTSDRAEILIGCAPLFRVPNDFQFEASIAEAKYVDCSSRNVYGCTGGRTALTAVSDSRFLSSPYTETEHPRANAAASTTIGGRQPLISSTQSDGWSRISNLRSTFDHPSTDRSSSRPSVSSAYYEEGPRFGISAGDCFLSSPSPRGSKSSPAQNSYMDAGFSMSGRYGNFMHPGIVPSTSRLPRSG